MVGLGSLYVWSTIGGSRSVCGLWHVGHSGVRAVAMVIFRTSGVTYIRRIGHAQGASPREQTYIYIVVKCYCVIRPANTWKSDISQL